MQAIQTRSLTKRYSDVTAVDGLSLDIRQGELFSLLGVNGAGKTTAIKSTLANEHRIDRFDAAFSGGVDAVFRCGYREYVSRRCFAEIRRRYESK